MTKRTSHLISLNTEEESDFQVVRKATGYGATAIFKAMVKSLKKTLPKTVEEEEI